VLPTSLELSKYLVAQKLFNVYQIHYSKMAEAPKSSGSLADRISESSPSSASPSATKTTVSNVDAPKDSKDPKTDLSDAQVDGASVPLGGSTLHEPQYDVEVKLSDIQGDSSSPLYSISSFEELGM
jgi:ATP-dependent RNA helicase DDX19/DBP5